MFGLYDINITNVLDECEGDLKTAHGLISTTASGYSMVKWLISSYKRPDIEEPYDGRFIIDPRLNHSYRNGML